jgi:hypothetical protein
LPSDFDPGGYGIAPPATSDIVVSAFTRPRQKEFARHGVQGQDERPVRTCEVVIDGHTRFESCRRGLTADLTELLEPDMHAV